MVSVTTSFTVFAGSLMKGWFRRHTTWGSMLASGGYILSGNEARGRSGDLHSEVTSQFSEFVCVGHEICFAVQLYQGSYVLGMMDICFHNALCCSSVPPLLGGCHPSLFKYFDCPLYVAVHLNQSTITVEYSGIGNFP